LTEYLDPARKTFLDVEEKSNDMDNRGEQLFYKLANLDDRIKNADQVSYLVLRLSWRAESSISRWIYSSSATS